MHMDKDFDPDRSVVKLQLEFPFPPGTTLRQVAMCLQGIGSGLEKTAGATDPDIIGLGRVITGAVAHDKGPGRLPFQINFSHATARDMNTFIALTVPDED